MTVNGLIQKENKVVLFFKDIGTKIFVLFRCCLLAFEILIFIIISFI